MRDLKTTASISNKRKKKKKYILICVFIFLIGYYLLYEVSTWFEVPLGNIFYVLVGCLLMASAGVYIGYAIKVLYFSKKKKKTKHFFLKNNKEESEKL
jgi:prolipoprotein diacylglyceryltransferase